MTGARSPLPFLAALFGTAALAGCSAFYGAESLVGLGPTRVALRELRIAVDADANKSTACRVDLVALFSDNAAPMLPATSSEWFAQKRALEDGLGTAIAVQSFELPPATLIEEADLPPDIERARGLRAYVDLQSSGSRHFIDLTAKSSAVLHITARGAVLQTEP